MSLTCVEELQEKVFFLEKKSEEFEASMAYASRLQQAILPNENLFKNSFGDAFVMYKPKDIISGDFYWIYRTDKKVYFAVGDCTGHGIPGAMLNIAGNALLREIIKQKGVSDLADIVSLLDNGISNLFNENLTVGNTRDGMDVAFCSIDYQTNTLSYCGAGRPLVLVRNNEVEEYKSGLNSVGYLENYQKSFNSVSFSVNEGDLIYLFSDGYTDQFGGENVKKFNRKRFRKLLLSISEMKLDKQRKELELAFENWKGSQEQIDDVCVVGIKV